MYLGWARGGALGAALVGLAFVLPSFFMVVAIALGYLRFGGLPWMQGAFYGIGAAVIAIIARSAAKLTRLTLGADRFLWGLFAVAALVTAWTESEIVWLFLGSGLLAMLVRGRPRGRASGDGPGARPCAAWPAHGSSGPRLGRDAVAPRMVLRRGRILRLRQRPRDRPVPSRGRGAGLPWLDERQFLDAVAVAMITPGPVVITVGFIGYLVAGLAGAVSPRSATFLPCYLFTVIPAPHFRRLSRNRAIKAFVDGVTAAATGAIAGAVFVLGRRALVDWATALVALMTLAVLMRFKRLPEPALIAAAGVAGVLLRG